LVNHSFLILSTVEFLRCCLSDSETYPLRTMHDFFEELGKEWEKFKLGAMGGTLASGILLIFAIRLLIIDLRIFRFRRSFFDLLDVAFSLIAVACLGYCVYSLLQQYFFFRKWQERLGRLKLLEEKLLGEEKGGEQYRELS